MGHMIEEIALNRGHEVVCRIDVDNQSDFESEAFQKADVAIEFTAPAVAFNNVQRAFAAGVKVVSGSTGWFAQHEDEVRRQCAEGGKTLFWASNFSVGVAIFGAVNRYLARIMNDFTQYVPSMEEVHHVHKLDHPSGTALTLAEQLIDEVDRVKETYTLPLINADGSIAETGKATNAKAPANALPIQSIRRGEVPGIHSITWNSEADSITITHDAHSRRGFALGAVIAAEYTAKHTGLLSMNDLFKWD